MIVKPARRPWQFKLSTALLLMLGASVLVGLLACVVLEYWKRNIQGISPELELIEYADPKQDAKNAIERNDFHFIGIYGQGLLIPGVAYAEGESTE